MGRRQELSLISDDIIKLLQMLGDELEWKGFAEPVRILLVGGVFMLLHGYRASTHDVDCVLLDLPDMVNQEAPEETQKFLRAVKAVADRMAIQRKWMNDDAALFVRDLAARSPLTLWATYNKLAVYLPAGACILANKLLAFREKDINDILILCQHLSVRTREQAQELLDYYAPVAWQEENMVDIALSVIFPDGAILDDEGMVSI